jgi:hypothetical protein
VPSHWPSEDVELWLPPCLRLRFTDFLQPFSHQFSSAVSSFSSCLAMPLHLRIAPIERQLFLPSSHWPRTSSLRSDFPSVVCLFSLHRLNHPIETNPARSYVEMGRRIPFSTHQSFLPSFHWLLTNLSAVFWLGFPLTSMMRSCAMERQHSLLYDVVPSPIFHRQKPVR